MKISKRLKLWWLRKKPERAFREDYATFALHGDNMWGNSITWSDGAPEDNEGRVHGWVERMPRVGDRLLVKMQSGKWAAWVFTNVEPCSNPKDMFFGDVMGALCYAEENEVPALASRSRVSSLGLV